MRKRKRLVFNWLTFALLCLCQVLQRISALDKNLPLYEQKILFTVGYDVVDYVILSIIVLNACAITKLVKIVKRAPQKQELNIGPVAC